ncbi:tetratricopeptide repeat protein [Massilia sp. Root418]|uniref:tetratricopeptide repeat protein n=1 Tax=Massilia sp. Root418 TaxID=1736532 RepID=UPI00138F0B34|nr:tetratricopeptide repeat protein [Massilia sp. Root418]
MALHQRGDLSQAEALYAEVLRREPDNFDALHLMGVLARQGGAPEAAVELIARAIALDAGKAIAHCNLGAALQDAGRQADALASYERALALQPAYPMALANRGNALRKLGRLDDALASYDAALAQQPAYPEALANRGIALHLLGRRAEALESFGRSLTLNPNLAESYCGAAVTLQSLGRSDEAAEAYRNAIEARPSYAEAWTSYGTLMQRSGDYQGALDCHQHALALQPDSAQAHLHRANALRALERPGEAAAAYRDAQACGADAASVAYQLAALGEAEAPAMPPPQYVAALFDQYADDFDNHLQNVLQYRAPQLLLAALDELGALAAKTDVLDLGCGTGLCGPLLRPYARTLAGVDLSPQMLEQARRRALYDELACADVVEYLQAREAPCGLLLAADVLVYFGDLQPVFRAARRVLAAGGAFAFTVEAQQSGDYGLRPTGRYAHSRSYLEALAQAHGFEVRSMTEQVLRKDDGRDIAGLVAVLAKLS